MKQLIFLLYLAAAAVATPHFHCNPNGPLTVTSSLSDFRLTTRREKISSYRSDLSCEFNAESPNSAFLLEVESFNVSSAVLSISSGDQLLFRGSSQQKHQTSIVTPSRQLRVRFDAARNRSNSEGVTVRVRAMDVNGCPPGWTYLRGSCFGTSSTSGRLDYFDAQRACNNMRANLLHMPSEYYGSFRQLMMDLPSHLSSYYAWIGITDRASRYTLMWLKGVRQYYTSPIGCISGGSHRTCSINERCAAWTFGGYMYSVYMDKCNDRNDFVCSAPPGGTSQYYSVPPLGGWGVTEGYEPPTSYVWVWIVVSACFVVGVFVIAVMAVRNHRTRRLHAAGATSVVVSSGPVIRTVAHPPARSYPQQPQHHLAPPYPTAGRPQPSYSEAPPSYDAVMMGQIDRGLQK